jgi:hypothetical protein
MNGLFGRTGILLLGRDGLNGAARLASIVFARPDQSRAEFEVVRHVFKNVITSIWDGSSNGDQLQ